MSDDTARKREPIPHSVDELTGRNVERVAALVAAAHAKETPADRVADAIAAFAGSMRFVWVSILMVGGWVVLNVVLPKAERFDPFPFQLLTLVLSVEAIFLAIFILMSQNRDARPATGGVSWTCSSTCSPSRRSRRCWRCSSRSANRRGQVS